MKKRKRILYVMLFAGALLVSLQLFAQEQAELTVTLSGDSEVALVYVEVLDTPESEDLDEMVIDKEKAFTLKRGRERTLSFPVGVTLVVLAEREWEGKVFRFAEKVTLSEDGSKVVILPELQE